MGVAPNATAYTPPASCAGFVVPSRSTEREYRVVVEQLERERQEASRRSQRLQEKLKELQKERDTALRKAADYRTKQTEAKEAARKEITGLQARLSKVITSQCVHVV